MDCQDCLETHASITTNNVATASTTNHSASVEYDGTTVAEAGVSVSNEYAEASVEVSLETGTKASASAGLEDKTVYAEVSYSDVTIAKVEVAANVEYEGVGAAVSGDVYAKSGTEAEAHGMIGEKGVDIGGSASTGSCVGADASATADLREASVTADGGCSVGTDHFEAGAGGQATFVDGQATIGVSGELAAVVGLDVDLAVTVDMKQIKGDVKEARNIVEEAAKRFTEEAASSEAKAAEALGKEAERVRLEAAKRLTEEAERVRLEAAEATRKEAERVRLEAERARQEAEKGANTVKKTIQSLGSKLRSFFG